MAVRPKAGGFADSVRSMRRDPDATANLTGGSRGRIAVSTPARANRPTLVIIRTPGCECCLGWVRHMEQAGFDVRVVEQPRLGPAMRGAGVPAAAVQRFLAAPGRWRGLAVPGMPLDSPGMEMEGQEDQTYEVRVFRSDGHHELFARARGADLF